MTDPLVNEAPVAASGGQAAGNGVPAAREGAEAPSDGAEAPLATTALAVRRAELGLSLEDVANQLKFAPRQIEALEMADFARLPGGTFARGMLRGYARLLKLDPEPVLAQLAAAGLGRQAGPEEAVSLRAPIPFSEGGRHVNLVYAVLSVLILAVVAFLALDWYREKGAAPKLAFVSPQQDASPGEAPPEAPAAPATFASAGPSPVAETTPHAEDKKPIVAPGKRRIVLHFNKESWVEIKAGNGELLLSQMNPAGTERVIDGVPPFLVTIGNAPNVRVTYNDLPVDLRPHFKVDVARLTLN